MNEDTPNKWRDIAEEATAEETTQPVVDEEHLLSEDQQNPSVSAGASQDALNKINLLEKQTTALNDQLARVQAEMANTQRRMEQEVSKARKFGVDRLLSDLVPVVDSLVHGLEGTPADDSKLQSVRKGMEMTLDLLLKLLEKNGVLRIDPKVGDTFDPTQHEAMSMQPHAELKSNTVLQVLQKGYALHGRVIRAAMVIVVA